MNIQLRTVLITGAVIAAVNIIFTGLQFGFAALPVWFYVVQLLLIPAMLIPLRYFPQAASRRDIAGRAVLFALGWAVPYAIYKFSSDVLNPAFSPAASLTSYLLIVLAFGVFMAFFRRPA